MNVGVREALARGAAYVLVVNSDVLVPPEAIERLERAMDAAPDVGIAGPLVLSRQAPDRIASSGMVWRRATARMRHQDVGRQLPEAPAGAAIERDGVSGCFMLVRREVFERIGLFDEDYFFSFEDLDLCLRARGAGFRTVVVPAATVFHEGGRSMGSASPRRLYFAARNHLRLAGRTEGGGGAMGATTRAALVVAYNLAHAVRAPGGSLVARLGAVARGTRDAWRGRWGPQT
jgi:hypothetical protein